MHNLSRKPQIKFLFYSETKRSTLKKISLLKKLCLNNYFFLFIIMHFLLKHTKHRTNFAWILSYILHVTVLCFPSVKLVDKYISYGSGKFPDIVEITFNKRFKRKFNLNNSFSWMNLSKPENNYRQICIKKYKYFFNYLK